MQLLSNILFVLESLFIIPVYYFSEYSNNWSSLPVTASVCVLGALGAVLRFELCHFLWTKLLIHS